MQKTILLCHVYISYLVFDFFILKLLNLRSQEMTNETDYFIEQNKDTFNIRPYANLQKK